VQGDGMRVSDFDVRGLTTLELGAGTALPSIMAALLGVKRAVVTDYPAPRVMDTLRRNVAHNTKSSFAPAGAPSGEPPASRVEVEGHGWGELETTFATANQGAFDRLFVCDCLWMPWQHANLHQSIAHFLKPGSDSRAWVVAGFHTGRAKMAPFFDRQVLANVGLEVERIWERDCNGAEREWVDDRGPEDITIRKRWLVVAVLKQLSSEDKP
jgi:EEF1A N-terminal glycine/lysine methyltransferase